MKESIRLALLSVLYIGLLTGCSISTGNRNSIQPSKNFITRNYKVKSFDRIDVNAVGDVHFVQSQDSSTSLSIYGPDNVVDIISVSVDDNTLCIDLKKDIRNNIKKLRLDITAPTLAGVSMKGVGNVLIAEPLRVDRLKVENTGVGNIEISNIEGHTLDIYSKGVGNIVLKGRMKHTKLVSKGVGEIDAEELKSAEVEVVAKGVGDVSCHATESIRAIVSGIGSIRYKGNPTKKSISKSGIGSIKQLSTPPATE